MIRNIQSTATKLPILGLLTLLVLTSMSAQAAESLFAPEPSQVPQPSVTATTAAMAEAAAAASSVPPISVTPDQSALLAQNQPAPTQVAPSSVSSATTDPATPSAASTNSGNSGNSTAASPSASPAASVSTTNAAPNLFATAPPALSGIASTNAPLLKKDIKESQPVLAKTVAPTIKPMPVDQPPNLDQPPDKMAATAPPAPPSENVTLNLINRLVQRGILTKEDAGDLIRQAQDDAKNAAQQAQMTQQATQQAAAAQQMAVEAAAPPSSDESVSVSYVPEIVKAEMKDEIKRDVLAAAQAENWTTPNYPSWINKIRPFMDWRMRYQNNSYPNNTTYNDETVPFDMVNFNAINTGSPLNMAAIPGSGAAYGLTGLYPNSIYSIPQNYYQGTGNGNGPSGYFTGQTPAQNPPTVNNTQQRQYERIRFRFGADMDLGENFTSGFRIGTGQNGNPVSENQTLGAVGSNGQGGNFSSYAIWVDRAFLKYEIGDNPDKMAALTFGRFDNPFYTPTSMMWANDIGFDGIAAQARYKIFKGFTPFATVGLFPIFNTDLNYSSTEQPKNSSNDKYLYAAQVGLDWKLTKDLNFKGAVGYYYFQNAQGQVSSPMTTPNATTQGDTDASRPTFAQTGNTYMELRNIVAVNAYPTSNPNGTTQGANTVQSGNYVPTPKTNTTTANVIYNPDYQTYVNTGGQYGVAPPASASTGYGTNAGLGYVPPPQIQNQYQYFGLATPFTVFSANGRLEYRHFEPFVVSVSGEFDRNLAWNSQNINNVGPAPDAANNYNPALTQGAVNNLSSGGVYQGGNNAWILQTKIGSGALQKRWDWDFGLSYRYVQSDAFIDGFADSDFGGPLAGTNLKGWAVGGNLALSKNVFLGARFFNATTIAGPTINVNTLQLDLNARF
jgi:hypothetical protein